MKNLPLEGVKNTRELGGLTVASGRRVKSGRLIRAAALTDLTERDRTLLCDGLGLKLIIDLRTAVEAEEKPDPALPGVEYLHLPLLSEATAGITKERTPNMKLVGRGSISGRELAAGMPDMAAIYPQFVTNEYTRGQLSAMMHRILAQEDGAVLFHCSGGKDRTGITAMLLETVLGADEKTCFRDYLFTNRAVRATGDKTFLLLLLLKGSLTAARKVRNIYLAKRSYLQSVYAAIDARGGMDRFLREDLGLTDDEMSRFRERTLE